MTEDAVVIASYARTPIGGFQGDLAGLKATQLGASAVRAAVERAGVDGEAIEKIFMGCVLPAGLGQAPARQAALGAGLPQSVEATTVNKMCGSGMQAAIMAHDAIRSEEHTSELQSLMRISYAGLCLKKKKKIKRKQRYKQTTTFNHKKLNKKITQST